MWSLLPLLAANQSCPSFVCGTTSSNKCIEVGDSVTFYPCISDITAYCPFSDFSSDSYCVSLPQSTMNTSFPGDSCTSNATCVYSNCYKGECQGLISSSQCNDTGQCTPGYRCEYGNCKAQLPLGASNGNGNNGNCTYDSDCVNNGVCDNGNCFEYFSKDETHTVGNCENGVSLICKSGLCYNGICLSEKMKSKNDITKPCSSDSDCYSDYYNNYPYNMNFTTQCSCGMDAQGSKYCGLFPGDAPMAKYISVFRDWINSNDATYCHSYSRYSLSCVKKYWSKDKYEKFAYYYYLVNMWRQIQNNEECVQDMVNSQYFKAKDAYDSSHGILIALGTIWLIL